MDGIWEPAQQGGLWGVRGDQEEGLGRACTTLTSPGGCDKTGMEPFSGREIWAPANVNALEELMHSMLICNASASWSHVWETGRVCEQIPNTLQVPRKLRAWRKEPLMQRSRSGKKFTVLIQLSGGVMGWESAVHLALCWGLYMSPQMILFLAQRETEHVYCIDEKVEVWGQCYSRTEFVLRLFSFKKYLF